MKTRIMKTRIEVILTALVFALSAGLAAHAAESPSSMPDWIKGHLEIGTRVTYFWLTDSKRDPNSGIDDSPGSFYGSINELDGKQDYLPLKIFVDYKFNRYFGAELTWDQFRADTITQNDGHTDGSINLIGPIASLFARCPTDTRFTPYVGGGIAYFFADFEENSVWHDPPGRGEIQTMDLNNEWAWLFYGGCNINISGPWSADMIVRYTKVETDGIHWNNGGIGGYPSFPMSNVSAGIGLRYSF